MFAGQARCLAAFLFIFPCRVAENVHQASAVGADDALGTGGLERFNFVLNHCPGNFRLLDGKSAAKTATFGFVILLGDLDAFQIAEQLATGEMNTHLTAR